jgi:hypothetical protein
MYCPHAAISWVKYRDTFQYMTNIAKVLSSLRYNLMIGFKRDMYCMVAAIIWVQFYDMFSFVTGIFLGLLSLGYNPMTSFFK